LHSATAGKTWQPGSIRHQSREKTMLTILLIVIVLLLLFGGGFGYSRRGRRL